MPALIPPLAAARTEIEIAGVPIWILAPAAAVLAAVILFGYRRERGLVPARIGRLLTTLRLAAALLLLALFLDVTVRRIEERDEKAEVLLVLDGSRSMALRDEHRPGRQKVREAAALGLIDRKLRETSAERALAALPDLARSEIPPEGWERIRAWAAGRGVPRGEIDAFEAEAGARREALAAAEAGPEAGRTAEALASHRDALRAALEGLGRRLDEALLASMGEEGRKAVASLDPLGRLELASAILGASAGGPSTIEALSDRFRIIPVELLAAPREVPRDATGRLLPFPPETAWTDIGGSISDEVSRRSREALAAVVLVSDGRHNRGPRPEDAMGTLAAMGIPLFALAVGAEEAPRNVRIADVDATGKVLAGDEVQVDVAIEATGMGPLSLPVRIGEGTTILKEETAAIPEGGGTVHVPVAFPAPGRPPGEATPAPGPRKFTVSIQPQPGEVADADNSRDFRATVSEEKVKVLLVDGGPRWEHRYLKAALGRDPNVGLADFLVTRPPDRRLPPGFPRDRDALFAHDAILIGDVEASVFSSEDLTALRDYVAARGGTLVLIAGPRAMPDDYGDTPLEELLPVRLRRPRPFRGEGALLAREGFSLRLTAEGERSPIARLVPGREANRELWGLLPPLDWFAPTLGARPGATVLAALPEDLAARSAGEGEGAATGAPGSPEAPGAAPPPAAGEDRGAVIATAPFGAGRVLFAGIDATWKWRYRTGDRLFARFWGQVVRWAASERLPPGDGSARIGLDEVRYESPARVSIAAMAASPDGKPMEDATVDAVVRHVPTGRVERARLRPVPRSGGLYRGTIEIDAGPGGAGAGEYIAVLDIPEIPGYPARADRATAEFVVEEPPSREASDLTRNEALLEEMVRAAAPGGRSIPIDRAVELPGLLPVRTLRREDVRTTGQWSLAWPILIAFTVLVAAEWRIRRKYDLV
jgi:hypothetical protein